MSYTGHLRLIILVAIGVFCWDNISYVPPPSEPVVAQVDTTREQLAERQLWLIRESQAYGLRKVSGIPGIQARRIVHLVDQEAFQYESVDRLLVLGLIVAESNANDRAISYVGARGLMQIMPATGQFIANNFGEEWEGKGSLYQVERNIRYGVWYLNHLQEQFPGNEQAMIAAYNWGPPNTSWRLRRGVALPQVYPGKVWAAKERIREEMYEFYREQLWRSLDLSQDPPHFKDHPAQPPSRGRHPRVLVHDGEGKLLREGPRVRKMSKLVPRGD